uniref:Putative secreted protein n=1 Tax=Anopheles marajoara TaxID=58244 RepID=A0A2M4CE66_9DIPT
MSFQFARPGLPPRAGQLALLAARASASSRFGVDFPAEFVANLAEGNLPRTLATGGKPLLVFYPCSDLAKN